ADVGERAHFAAYMSSYEDMIRHTSTEWAPWHVVPADNKWFTRLVVASATIECLASLDLDYPKLSKDELKELEAARQLLVESE
ncbi:MAG: polyphosphate kinase 2 family protein, partial [Pyrinomonadaceae bacterium]